MKVADLFRYVWPFSGHQTLKIQEDRLVSCFLILLSFHSLSFQTSVNMKSVRLTKYANQESYEAFSVFSCVFLKWLRTPVESTIKIDDYLLFVQVERGPPENSMEEFWQRPEYASHLRLLLADDVKYFSRITSGVVLTLLILRFIFDRVFSTNKYNLCCPVFFSAEVCPMQSVILRYICGVKVHEYITVQFHSSTWKRYLQYFTCPVDNGKQAYFSKVQWIDMKSRR